MCSCSGLSTIDVKVSNLVYNFLGGIMSWWRSLARPHCGRHHVLVIVADGAAEVRGLTLLAVGRLGRAGRRVLPPDHTTLALLFASLLDGLNRTPPG